MSLPTLALRVSALLVLTAIASPVWGQLTEFGYWNFNSGMNENGTNALGYLPDEGKGFLLVGEPEISLGVPNPQSWRRDFEGANRGVTAFAGSDVNAINGELPGLALALQGGFLEDNSNPPNNNRWIEVQANLTGYINPILSFAMFGSFQTPGGFNNNQFSWSEDGTTYTNFDDAFDPTASAQNPAYRRYEFDLSAIDALDEDASVFLRITFNGATSNGGHNRIDNILLLATAIPEPTSAALAGLFLMAGLAGWRRRKG